MKNHVIPKLTLKKFRNKNGKLSVFNIAEQKLYENQSVDKSFVIQDCYTDEIEEKLNKKVESLFADLFNNHLINIENEIRVNRKQVKLIKKFLLISILRANLSDDSIHEDRNFYSRLEKITGSKMDKPFDEDDITKKLSNYDYWMQSLDVILETDGTPIPIFKHAKRTLMAWRWACVVNTAYLSFWDSQYLNDEFIITDIGMTSENEKGWNGHYNKNIMNFLMKNFSSSIDENKRIYFEQMQKQTYFHENFMMFPISNKRMICLINPFYKFIFENNLLNSFNIKDNTLIVNTSIFTPNKTNYKNINEPFNEEDEFIYKIYKLSSEDTQYCNALFLDRIENVVAFSSLDKTENSFKLYYRLTKNGLLARNNYNQIYNIIDVKD